MVIISGHEACDCNPHYSLEKKIYLETNDWMACCEVFLEKGLLSCLHLYIKSVDLDWSRLTLREIYR